MRTQFFTGAGDKGESSAGKIKLPKSDPVFSVLGGLDELNSWLGFCTTEKTVGGQDGIDIKQVLKQIQNSLFIAQAELAQIAFNYPASKKITADKTAEMEEVIRVIDEIVPAIKSFIIPGGTELAARLDYGRTLARRVEREAKKLAEARELSPEFLTFLNRLSSILFALARYVNFKAGIQEENPSY